MLCSVAHSVMEQRGIKRWSFSCWSLCLTILIIGGNPPLELRHKRSPRGPGTGQNWGFSCVTAWDHKAAGTASWLAQGVFDRRNKVRSHPCICG